MIWIGLLVGIGIGAVLWGFEGAIVLGFVGWLAGVVLHSRTRPASTSAVKPAVETLSNRVARLEKAVAELQARLDAQGVAEARPEAEPVAPIVEPDLPPVPPAPPAAPPETPRPPNPFMRWLAGGNTIARVGLLILFIGFAFLLKYAADHRMLPVELRVAGVAAGGIALLMLGWRLRERNRGYALGMQGAGVAVLYLTIFAAMRLWKLIPPEAAFALLAAIAVFSAILAIRQDALVLAAFGAGGGFVAPILTSTGEGSHVMLFSYYLVLNLGIAAIAWHKAWRPLNVLGFLFTFFIGLAWGLKYYRPEHFETTEPFLIAFFVLYVAIALLFARRQAPELKRYVDGTVVFGTPLAAFGLQAGLVHGMEFGLAFSSLVLAAFYMVLAWTLKRTHRESFALLAEAFVALGVVFLTAAIPLALDARCTSAAWALEGAAIVWVGLRQGRTLARAFGLLLQLLAGLAYLESYGRLPNPVPLVDAPFVGALLLALAGLWTHRLLAQAARNAPSESSGASTAMERSVVPFAFAWGLAWWIFAGHHEIVELVPRVYTLNAHVAFITATALVLGAVALRWDWREARWSTRLLLPALVALALVSLAGHRHPFAHMGWVTWPFALGAHFWLMRRLEPANAPRLLEALHAGGMLLIAALGAKELHWVAATYTARETAWSVGSVIVIPALLVLAVSSRAADWRWPIATQGHAYRATATAALAIAMVAWSFYANVTHDGTSEPLPYLPILNALDLAHLLMGAALASAWLALRRTPGIPSGFMPGKGAIWTAGIVAFIWLTGVLLRTLHHWADVSYDFHSMRRSVLAQASLSVFWSLLALALMMFATRTARRAAWMVGAGLMAVVVVKLFVVDLSRVQGVERIVSFIAVGVLMLVIGYFSPVPPRKPEASA
ncbi:MAG TPA: DUF2339 domain-containing protein [Usitatibacter sp.]|nr:DUF2339 domain-containing protein [Usitatibacter sp.]